MQVVKAVESSEPILFSIPFECLLYILSFLEVPDIACVQLVCKHLLYCALDNVIWLRLCNDIIKEYIFSTSFFCFSYHILGLEERD